MSSQCYVMAGKVFLLGYFIMMSIGCAQGDAKCALFVMPRHNEMGLVDAGKEVVAKFELVNQTGKHVNISQILPSCSCSHVELSVNPIPPSCSAELSVTIDVSHLAGRVQQSIIIYTNHSQYDRLIATLELIVPASGSRSMVYDIGYFHARMPVNFHLPCAAFSSDKIFLKSFSADGAPLSVTQANDKSELVIQGTAPTRVGKFFIETELVESFQEDGVRAGKRDLTVKLTGTVVRRLDLPADIYLGFVDISHPAQSIKYTANMTSLLDGKSNAIVSVMAKSSAPWIRSVDAIVDSSGSVDLHFQINDKYKNEVGANSAAVQLNVTYADGTKEEYDTNVHVHLVAQKE